MSPVIYVKHGRLPPFRERERLLWGDYFGERDRTKKNNLDLAFGYLLSIRGAGGGIITINRIVSHT